MHRIRRSTRLALAIALLAVVAIAAGSCSSKKKSTNPQPTETIIGEWPADAQGQFLVLVEYWNCGLFNCNWDSLDAFEADVCGDMFIPQTDSSLGFIVHKVEAVLSDTLYEIRAEGAVQMQDSSWCDIVMTLSSRETGMPPARDQWQVVIKTTFTNCDVLTVSLRYTFTRLGDISCEGLAVPAFRRGILIAPWSLPRGAR